MGEKITAPMQGSVSVAVSEGAQVTTGDIIAVLTSGKTVTNIKAPASGVVRNLIQSDTKCNIDDVIAELDV